MSSHIKNQLQSLSSQQKITAAAVTGFLLVLLFSMLYSSRGGDSLNDPGFIIPLADPTQSRTRVSALGRIEPISEVVDVSGIAGQRLINLLVTQDATVSKGDVIAHLDGYESRIAAVSLAEVRLAEGRELHAAETRSGEAAIEEAELLLEQVNTLSALEIKMQQAAVNRIESDLANARKSTRRLEQLRDNNSIPEQTIDDQRTAELRLAEELAASQFALARLTAKKDLDSLVAQQRLTNATAALSRAQVGSRLASLEADLELAKAELERVQIRAPIAGRILKILTRPGERIEAMPILKLGNTDYMYVIAEVYETDIRLVDIGMAAIIGSPALTEPLTGYVESISPLVFKNDILNIDPTAKIDARVVEVRIRLDDSTTVAGLSNLQVQVNIQLSGVDSTEGGK